MWAFNLSKSFRSVVLGVSVSGSIPLLVLGLVALLLTYMLFCLTNHSTAFLSQQEVPMIKQMIIPLVMFANNVAINLFSTGLGVAQT